MKNNVTILIFSPYVYSYYLKRIEFSTLYLTTEFCVLKYKQSPRISLGDQVTFR